MFCKSIENFLRRASPGDIVEFLTNEAEESTGCDAMRWLLAHQRQKAYESLCLLYDVAAYQVGSSCFSGDAAACEQNHWFIAVSPGAGWSEENIPLCETKELAYATAAATLKLEQLFFCSENKAKVPCEDALAL